MPITRVQARALTTKPEQELVEESFHPRVRALSSAQLRQRIERARRMQDKYTDLGRRQHGASKGRKSAGGRPREKANVRTDRKATLFAETLERFEKRLAKLQAEEASSKPTEGRKKAAGKGGGQGRSKPPSKTRGRSQGDAQNSSAMPPSRQGKHTQARGKAVHGHVKARGRRTQARKDSR